MADKLRKRFKKLKLPKDARLAFISHHKATGGVTARLLHDRFCEILALPSSSIFLDSNDLTNLTTLPEQVRKCQVLCLLQTGGVLTRPYVLVEVYSAFKKNIPVVAVNVEGAGYDFADADAFLNAPDFGAELEKRNPGALKVLQDMQIDVQDIGRVLGHQIPKVISTRLAPHESDRVLAVSIEVILDKILTEIENRRPFSNPRLIGFSSSPGIVPPSNVSTALHLPSNLATVDDVEKGRFAALNDERQKNRCCNCRNRKEARICYLRVFTWQMCLFWGIVIAAGLAAIIYFAVTPISSEFSLGPIATGSSTSTAGANFGFSVASSDVAAGFVRIIVGAPGQDSLQGRVYIYDYSVSTNTITQTQDFGAPAEMFIYPQARFGSRVLINDNALMIAIGAVASSNSSEEQDLLIMRRDDQVGQFLTDYTVFKQVRHFDWNKFATIMVVAHSNSTINTFVRSDPSAGNVWTLKHSFQAPALECHTVALNEDGTSLALGCPLIDGETGGVYIYAQTDPLNMNWSPNITTNGQMLVGSLGIGNPFHQGARMSFSKDSTRFFVTGMGTFDGTCYGYVFQLLDGTWRQNGDMMQFPNKTSVDSAVDGCTMEAKRLNDRFVLAVASQGAAIYSTLQQNLFQPRLNISASGTFTKPNVLNSKGYSVAITPSANLLVMSDPNYGTNGVGRVVVQTKVNF